MEFPKKFSVTFNVFTQYILKYIKLMCNLFYLPFKNPKRTIIGSAFSSRRLQWAGHLAGMLVLMRAYGNLWKTAT
jgi:hypothetical protein